MPDPPARFPAATPTPPSGGPTTGTNVPVAANVQLQGGHIVLAVDCVDDHHRQQRKHRQHRQRQQLVAHAQRQHAAHHGRPGNIGYRARRQRCGRRQRVGERSQHRGPGCGTRPQEVIPSCRRLDGTREPGVFRVSAVPKLREHWGEGDEGESVYGGACLGAGHGDPCLGCLRPGVERYGRGRRSRRHGSGRSRDGRYRDQRQHDFRNVQRRRRARAGPAEKEGKRARV